MSEMSPQVIIISGPNGAGKTSLAPFLLQDRYAEFPFVNADAIASGLSAFEPETVAIEAGRVMLARLHELSGRRENFVFESTLAARSYAPWLSRLRQEGYEVHLLFVWLRSVDLAIERVAERVRRGGHAIPSHELRRRYRRGVHNLFELYIPLADTWAIYDNSEEDRAALVATGMREGRPKVSRADLWQMLLESRK
ncbi:MAG: Zeta toxin family protein [Acidobacteria bacterium]|nr:MAG: Zeta toxin family protein [Acidobacteriota bacterium]